MSSMLGPAPVFVQNAGGSYTQRGPTPPYVVNGDPIRTENGSFHVLPVKHTQGTRTPDDDVPYYLVGQQTEVNGTSMFVPQYRLQAEEAQLLDYGFLGLVRNGRLDEIRSGDSGFVFGPNGVSIVGETSQYAPPSDISVPIVGE